MRYKLFKKIINLFTRPFSSFFGSYFISFWLFTTLLLVISTYISYRDTVQSEIDVFNSRVDKATLHMQRLVNSYNSDIDDLYAKIDHLKFKRIIKKTRPYSKNPRKLTQEFLDNLAAEEGIVISLIDAKSTQVIASSKKTTIGIATKETYPGIERSIFSRLKPRVPHFKISWIDNGKTLAVFARELTLNRKYIWQVALEKIRSKPINRLINFFKNAEDFDPLITKVGLYNIKYQPLHGLDQLKLPKRLSFDQTKKCSFPGSCTVWMSIDTSTIKNKKCGIEFVGIEFQQEILVKRLDYLISKLYKMILYSLFFSFLVSLVVTRFITVSIYKIINFLKKYKADGESNEKFPQVYNRELNTLGSAFNNLIVKLKKKETENRTLASKLLNIADEERRLISRDLHDSIGQLIIAARLKISENEPAEAKDLLLTASEELRNIYDELEPRSLEKMSLKLAIEWYLFKFFSEDLKYKIDVIEAEKLPAPMRLIFYRIIQEAIANVKKHSPKCRKIEIITSKTDDFLQLLISNDLVGDSSNKQQKSGRGLTNIQLRAESLGGKLLVKSTKQSFELLVTIKVPNNINPTGEK